MRELYAGPQLEIGAPRRAARSAAPRAPSRRRRARSADAPPHAALAALDVALDELAALRGRLEPAAFDAALALVAASRAKGGRVHVTGIGKPEHVARYAASLFASTGTPASFLHGTEAVHGSAGQVVAGDVVVAISNSGAHAPSSSPASRRCAGSARASSRSRATLASPLARAADVVLDAGVAREGGGLGLAPRASVAAELLVLAALSAALEEERGFTRADYHARHPAGKLGEKSGTGSN